MFPKEPAKETVETEIYTWLCSFINMERGLGGKAGAAEHFKLDRMKILAELAGHPETSAPAIHIAGSKGKGSVCALAASALEAAGSKTARYMSPHVLDWRERISRGRGFFPAEVYRAAEKELRQVYEAYRRCGPIKTGDPGEPTFFELATLYFFLCARQDRCSFMVIETGLGGRLDATNIVDPVLSVITPIEKEHTEYLGNTLEAIAGEKAGIIKPGRPVLSARQEAEVLAVLKRTAEERAAPFCYLPDEAEIADCRVHPGGTDFVLRENGTAEQFSLSLTGGVYADNAALAVRAVRGAFPGIDDGAVKRALAAASLPARFEKRFSDPPCIIDGAHTPASVFRCAETFRKLYGTGGVLLFGCAADKDAKAMAEILAPSFSRCIITGTGTFRSSDPAAVFAAFKAAAEKFRTAVTLVPEPAEAAAEVLRLGKAAGLPVLCCGSFYLAAEINRAVPPSGDRE